MWSYLGSWPWPDNTTSFFQNFRVQADANGDPVPFTDAQGQYASGPKYLNFLLDAGPIPANEVVVSGEVFADLNGDGIDNNDDAPGVDFVVYADINQSGQFEATDPFTLTDHLGQYTLTIPTGTTEVFNIGAVPPTPNWVQTFPATTFTPVLGGPGAAQTNVKFGFEPIIIEPPPVPQPGSIPASMSTSTSTTAKASTPANRKLLQVPMGPTSWPMSTRASWLSKST
jgi:hypothetical protein